MLNLLMLNNVSNSVHIKIVCLHAYNLLNSVVAQLHVL